LICSSFVNRCGRWPSHMSICARETRNRYGTSDRKRKWNQELLANTREFNYEHNGPAVQPQFSDSLRQNSRYKDGTIWACSLAFSPVPYRALQSDRFHGGNTGSNPVGAAKSFQQLTISLLLYIGQKRHNLGRESAPTSCGRQCFGLDQARLSRHREGTGSAFFSQQL
jgi:hypothetical protein